MHKLLHANFARLWRNKVFWLGAAFMAGAAVLMVVQGRQDALAHPGEASALDKIFFQYAPLAGGVCAVFTSLFLGTDYSDGTIRNKIAAGHSRSAVYLANSLVCLAAGLLMNAAWVAAMLAVGTPLLGWPQCGAPVLLAYLLISACMIAAFVAVFTLMGMLNQNKAGAAVAALLCFLVLLFAASYCYNRLQEPEMYSAATIVMDGGVQMTEPMPNPDYLRGDLRKVYGFLVEFLPTGQGILLSELEAPHPLRLPAYSLFITVAATATGLAAFRRKDIR